jgi:dTDP-4-dehydrorhamnose 3,5-epimerase
MAGWDKSNEPPQGVLLTPVRIIPNDNGDILHGLKATDQAYVAFGEAYFSTISFGKKKGWKKHLRMTLNVVVPIGEIEFVLFDERPGVTNGRFYEVTLSRKNYFRLTVPPGIWMAFHGKAPGESMLLNIASIPHDPTEAQSLPIENELIKYSWQ